MWAAITPARCAAPPAPAIRTRRPCPSASFAKRATRSGERCADETCTSKLTSNSCRILVASSMVGRSESLPIRIATSGAWDFARVMLASGIAHRPGLESHWGGWRSIGTWSLVIGHSPDGLAADVGSVVHAGPSGSSPRPGTPGRWRRECPSPAQSHPGRGRRWSRWRCPGGPSLRGRPSRRSVGPPPSSR